LNLATSELTAELLLELLPLLPELPELFDLLLEPPQAASPMHTSARSPGRNTPSNLDLDRISIPFG
jgi:hypothetical protein